MSTVMMKAYRYHGPEKMSLDQVPKPKIIEPTDAIVKVTTSTICGTDKHIRHGGLPEVEPGRIIGHEFCGIVDEVGPGSPSLSLVTAWLSLASPSVCSATTAGGACILSVSTAAGSSAT